MQLSADFVRYLCKNSLPSLAFNSAKHLSTCLSLIAPLKSMKQLIRQQDTDQGFTPMDALHLMIKNNFYLGAGKAFVQACCLLVSSMNVLLIRTTQAPQSLYEIFGRYTFSMYPSSAFLLYWM